MKKRHVGVLLVLVVLALFNLFAAKRGTVLYAQSVPFTATVEWTPNASTDNVSSYGVQLDGGAVQTVLASSCTATLCTAAVQVPTFGNHTASVFATNLNLTGGTGVIGTPQNSTLTLQAFALNPKPGQPTNAKIRG
jgi:hypothetical protein